MVKKEDDEQPEPEDVAPVCGAPPPRVEIDWKSFDPPAENPCDYSAPVSLDACVQNIINCEDCCLAAGRHNVTTHIGLGKKNAANLPQHTYLLNSIILFN